MASILCWLGVSIKVNLKRKLIQGAVGKGFEKGELNLSHSKLGVLYGRYMGYVDIDSVVFALAQANTPPARQAHAIKYKHMFFSSFCGVLVLTTSHTGK